MPWSAQLLFTTGAREGAERECRNILRRYPDTEAAASARELLAEMKPAEPPKTALGGSPSGGGASGDGGGAGGVDDAGVRHPRGAGITTVQNPGEAQNALERAQLLFTTGAREGAERECRNILRRYPDTEAAASARKLLAEMKPAEPPKTALGESPSGGRASGDRDGAGDVDDTGVRHPTGAGIATSPTPVRRDTPIDRAAAENALKKLELQRRYDAAQAKRTAEAERKARDGQRPTEVPTKPEGHHGEHATSQTEPSPAPKSAHGATPDSPPSQDQSDSYYRRQKDE